MIFMEDKAYAVRIEEYDPEELKKVFREIMDFPENKDVFVPGRKAFLKLNLLTRRPPSSGVTVHPLFVRGLILALEEKNISVLVGDSPAGHYEEKILDAIYKTCGIKDAILGTNAVLNYDTSYRIVKSPAGKSYPIITPALDAEILIDVAKLKTHSYTLFTGAVKNMYGVIPGQIKTEYHAKTVTPKRFCKMIVDICETAKPSFCFMDGIVGMEGNGPSGGTTFKGNLLLASKSPYALDMAALKLVKIPYKRVLTEEIAVKNGLCPEDVTIETFSKSLSELMIENLKLPDNMEKNNWIVGLLRPISLFFSPYPKILKECIGCGECVRACPQKTIKIVGGKAQIDKKDCIRCYCCQELCPHKAIVLKQ